MVAGAATAASAEPLGLAAGAPDLSGSALFSYDSATQLFEASGSISGLFDGSSVFGVSGGVYNLSATIIDPINQIASGVLEITGAVGSMGIAPGTRLIRGAITQFGYDNSVTGFGGFDFKFDVLDGALSPMFGPKGGSLIGPAEVLPASWSFGSSFAGATGTTDTFAVPEPTSAFLILAGLGGFLARRRLQSRVQN
jgi:hypothetical protein